MALALLAEEGINCQARRVATLEEFTDALQKGSFDLILSDLSSIVDGLTALSISRQIQPQLPFIFLTDSNDVKTAVKANKSGATDYLPKGRLSHLPPAVKKALTTVEGQVHEATTETPVNDEIRNYKIIAYPVLDQDVNVVGVIEIVGNVTQSKRVKPPLFEEEHRRGCLDTDG